MARKNVAMKTHQKVVDELKKSEDARAALQRSFDYHREQASSSDRKFKEQEKEWHDAMQSRDRKFSAMRNAVMRAHAEVSNVKPGEDNDVALQRVLGSVQGALAIAIDQCDHHHAGLLDLYPEDKEPGRTIREVEKAMTQRHEDGPRMFLFRGREGI